MASSASLVPRMFHVKILHVSFAILTVHPIVFSPTGLELGSYYRLRTGDLRGISQSAEPAWIPKVEWSFQTNFIIFSISQILSFPKNLAILAFSHNISSMLTRHIASA